MTEATVDDPRGLKRICLNCSTRFFDLNKRPIVCPQCQTEFTGEVKIKPKRGRLLADDDEGQVSENTEIEDDEDLIDEDEDDTVSLEEVEDMDDDADDETSVLDDDLDADLDDDLVDEDLDDLDDDDDLDVDLDEEK